MDSVSRSAFLHQCFRHGQIGESCGGPAEFFSLQVWTSGHGAVFAAVSIGLLYLLWRIALGEPITPLRRLRDLHVPGVAAARRREFCRCSHVRAVQGEVGLRRTIRDALHLGAKSGHAAGVAHYVHQWLMSLWTDWPVLSEAKGVSVPGVSGARASASSACGRCARPPARTGRARDRLTRLALGPRGRHSRHGAGCAPRERHGRIPRPVLRRR